jgi:hypothetical protein
LWRGLLHTTRTTPRRRTTLHLSQIRLTLAFTFITRTLLAPLPLQGNGVLYPVDSRFFKAWKQPKRPNFR